MITKYSHQTNRCCDSLLQLHRTYCSWRDFLSSIASPGDVLTVVYVTVVGAEVEKSLSEGILS